MDTSLKNQNVKVGPLMRERIMSVVGLLLIPLFYVIFLSESSTYDPNKRYGVIMLIALFIFFFLRTLFFHVEANQTGIVACNYFVPRKYSYEELDEVRIVRHATKPSSTVEIRRNGKRVAFYNDLSKNSDPFIEKLRLHGVSIGEKRSV